MSFLCRILATRLRHIRIDPSGQFQDPVLLPRDIYLYILHTLLSLLYTCTDVIDVYHLPFL